MQDSQLQYNGGRWVGGTLTFHRFIEELRKLGYEQRGEWPFNVECLGYVTVCAYIAKVLAQTPARQCEILGGQDAVRKVRADAQTYAP